MTWLTVDELDARSDEFDAQVAVTPEIDHFCSSSTWVIPAARAAAPDQPPFICQTEAGTIAMLILSVGDGHRAAVPLEFGWGLAAPFAGADPDRLVGLLARMWSDRRDEVDMLLVSGIPTRGVWMRALSQRFLGTHRIGLGEECVRRLASLEGGLDGYLSRRSAKFRANMRRDTRRRLAENLCVDYHRDGDPNQIFQRIIDVETDSWKGRQGEGFNTEPGLEFYRRILRRLHERRQLRVLFIQRDGEDLAFVIGAVVDRLYRGLQVSFRQGFASFSLGNLAQYELIARLISEGVTTYDLGTDMDYKARWAESVLATRMVAIVS